MRCDSEKFTSTYIFQSHAHNFIYCDIAQLLKSLYFKVGTSIALMLNFLHTSPRATKFSPVFQHIFCIFIIILCIFHDVITLPSCSKSCIIYTFCLVFELFRIISFIFSCYLFNIIIFLYFFELFHFFSCIFLSTSIYF